MTDIPLKDGDYCLVDGKAWFTVDKFAIRICLTEYGVVRCSIYENGNEMDPEIAYCEGE